MTSMSSPRAVRITSSSPGCSPRSVRATSTPSMSGRPRSSRTSVEAVSARSFDQARPAGAAPRQRRIRRSAGPSCRCRPIVSSSSMSSTVSVSSGPARLMPPILCGPVRPNRAHCRWPSQVTQLLHGWPGRGPSAERGRGSQGGEHGDDGDASGSRQGTAMADGGGSNTPVRTLTSISESAQAISAPPSEAADGHQHGLAQDQPAQLPAPGAENRDDGEGPPPFGQAEQRGPGRRRTRPAARRRRARGGSGRPGRRRSGWSRPAHASG